MFECCMCKKVFTGEPARRTGRGYKILWCRSCSDENAKRAVAAMQRARPHQNIKDTSRCSWCGVLKTIENSNQAGKNSGFYYLCRECEAMDRRLQKCVAFSPALAIRINKLEKAGAIQRQKLAEANATTTQKPEPLATITQHTTQPTNTDLQAVNAKLDALIRALGGL